MLDFKKPQFRFVGATTAVWNTTVLLNMPTKYEHDHPAVGRGTEFRTLRMHRRGKQQNVSALLAATLRLRLGARLVWLAVQRALTACEGYCSTPFVRALHGVGD